MIRNGWVVCPQCGQRLFPLGEQTVIRHLVYRCRRCKREFAVDTDAARGQARTQKKMAQNPAAKLVG